MLHVPLGNSLIVSSNLWVLNTFESGGILVAPKQTFLPPSFVLSKLESTQQLPSLFIYRISFDLTELDCLYVMFL